MSTTQRIGFGKKIRLDWLVLALRLRAAGADFEAAREPLSVLISQTNKGKVTFQKALSAIRQMVFAPSKENEAFTSDGIALIREFGTGNALEIAWGLSLVSYSFFALTAETTGRILRLNESLTAAELIRRLIEKAGDRGFVSRVARYNLSSLLDWEVIKVSPRKKYYCSGSRRKIRSVKLAAWLLEAALKVSKKSALPLQQLTTSPALFPFELPVLPVASIAAHNHRLAVTRQSLNDELVGFHE